jgi:hypothetical protein
MVGVDKVIEQHPLVRSGTIALGVALTLFSAPAIFFPRFFARQVGLSVPDEPSAVAIRSVAVRDAVMGVGLVSAAVHGSRLAPWLMMRALCDGGDAAAIGVAFVRGAGGARLGGLGLLALGAAAYDALLWRMALKR